MLYEFSNQINDFFGRAQHSAVIVAPYIKTHALTRVLRVMSSDLQDLIVVTRWAPEDIVSGVCDLQIFEHVQNRNATLKIHPHLHAKYYRVDGHCLVGSANLTGRGFGWSWPANIELFVELTADHEGLIAWEKHLIRSCVTADEDIRDAIKAQVEEIKSTNPEVRYTEELSSDDIDIPELELENWTPSCPVPDRLWDVYCGRGKEAMVTTAYEAAKRDLAVLAPPKGLAQPLFKRFLKGILRQMPLIHHLDQLTKQGLTDHEAIAVLRESASESRPHHLDPERAWKIIKDWFICFFPNEYRIETGQEILVQGRRIDL